MISIYTLTDPLTGEIRYVGQAQHPSIRLSAHLTEARKGTHIKAEWIRALLALGARPTLAVVARVEPSLANAVEREWIARIADAGAPLLNVRGLSDAGAVGRALSVDNRRRIIAGRPVRQRKPRGLAVRIQVTPKDVSAVDCVRGASVAPTSRTAVAGEAFRRGLALLVAEARKGEPRRGKRAPS